MEIRVCVLSSVSIIAHVLEKSAISLNCAVVHCTTETFLNTGANWDVFFVDAAIVNENTEILDKLQDAAKTAIAISLHEGRVPQEYWFRLKPFDLSCSYEDVEKIFPVVVKSAGLAKRQIASSDLLHDILSEVRKVKHGTANSLSIAIGAAQLLKKIPGVEQSDIYQKLRNGLDTSIANLQKLNEVCVQEGEGGQSKDANISEHDLEKISMACPAAFYVREMDEPYCVRFVSEKIVAWGFSVEELKGCKNFLESYVHPDDLEIYLNALEEVKKNGEASCRFRLRSPNGTYLWFSDSLRASTNKRHNKKEIIGFWNNVDEEMRTFARAKVLENTLNQTVIVATTDLAGRIISVNRKFCEISGYSEDELLGKTHRIVNSGYHPRSFFENMWKEITAGRVWRGEVKNRRKDGGYYWVDTYITPVFNEFSKLVGFVSVRNDITAKKNVEESLVHSAKMVALGELAGAIAHEILNPVAIIDGTATRIKKMIDRSNVDVGELGGHCETLKKTSERIVKIINGLRTMTRNADDDPLRLISLKDVLNEITALLSARLKSAGVEFSFIGTDTDVEFFGNKTQIGQVFLNLIGNSLDAIQGQSKKEIVVTVTRHDCQFEIVITDSGPEIPPDVKQKIFTPFFTTKEAGKGTGIGLSISRKILKQHGGDLRLDMSCPQTRFIMTLPLPSESSS